MTDVAALPSFTREASQSGFPLVRPRWLGPMTTTAALLGHVALGLLFLNFALEKIVPLDSIGADLIPEGDQFESVEQVELDDVPPLEAMEQPDFAIPPPLVDWQFNLGLRTVQRILVTPCEIPGPAVSIERVRQWASFLGRN